MSTDRKSPNSRERLRQALQDERWFGDEPPTWKKAELAAAAKRRRELDVKRLHRAEYGTGSMGAIAERLSKCAPGQRCLSAACAECARAAQRFVAHSLRQVIRKEGEGTGKLVAFTLAPAEGTIPFGNLKNCDSDGLKTKLGNALEEIDQDAWTAVGLDFSYNIDRDRILAPVFQTHLQGVSWTSDQGEFRKLLGKRYRKNAWVRRPLKVTACDGSHYALSYILKPNFVRRVSYTKVKGDKQQRDTDKLAMKGPERDELLAFLGTLEISDRLLLRGLHLTETKHGTRIRRIPGRTAGKKGAGMGGWGRSRS